MKAAYSLACLAAGVAYAVPSPSLWGHTLEAERTEGGGCFAILKHADLRARDSCHCSVQGALAQPDVVSYSYNVTRESCVEYCVCQLGGESCRSFSWAPTSTRSELGTCSFFAKPLTDMGYDHRSIASQEVYHDSHCFQTRGESGVLAKRDAVLEQRTPGHKKGSQKKKGKETSTHHKGKKPTATTTHHKGKHPTETTTHHKGKKPTETSTHHKGKHPTSTSTHHKGKHPTSTSTHHKGKHPTSTSTHHKGKHPTSTSTHRKGKHPTSTSTHHHKGKTTSTPTHKTTHKTTSTPTTSPTHKTTKKTTTTPTTTTSKTHTRSHHMTARGLPTELAALMEKRDPLEEYMVLALAGM